mmetsp:Transcript_7328/g.17623  ORF Transcript_7328/g.17623 Transcript_7328/m.17623 type:complete len:314 (-) Transcript_7328:788-1729(-)
MGYRWRFAALATLNLFVLVSLAISRQSLQLEFDTRRDEDCFGKQPEQCKLEIIRNVVMDSKQLSSVSVFIGTRNSEFLRIEKGPSAPRRNESIPVASATKWVTGLIVMVLIQDGTLELDSKPHELLGFWSREGRFGRVTLQHLLSFTSSLLNSHHQNLSSCINNTSSFRITDCARDIYFSYDLLPHEPGTVFGYSTDHLEIAAAMAEVATGKPWNELYDDLIVKPLRLGNDTTFEISSTSYGLRIAAEGYISILREFLMQPRENGLHRSTLKAMNRAWTVGVGSDPVDSLSATVTSGRFAMTYETPFPNAETF